MAYMNQPPGGYDGGVEGFIGCGIGIGEGITTFADELQLPLVVG